MKNPRTIKIIENMEDMHQVVDLQRQVWSESETDLVPAHLMNSAVHNGGLLIGAYQDQELVGFVFGFPGLYSTPDGPRLKHYSSMLGVKPELRGQGIGFTLKRAQWQMVRHMGIDRISWTYDPLLSQNAWLNIAHLGAVCSTYLCDFYGRMDDHLNRGLPSDRFDVDWWVNSHRVNHRLSRRRRNHLSLEHFQAGGAPIFNQVKFNQHGIIQPAGSTNLPLGKELSILLVEIPADFQAIKDCDLELALEWRIQTRSIFELLFKAGYIVTDFVHETNQTPRSYYVLCHGESTL